LQEKHDCGLISDEEWAKIESVAMRRRLRVYCG
jgi:hypothetical protein